MFSLSLLLLSVLSPSSFWPTLTSRLVSTEPSSSACRRVGRGAPIRPRPDGARFGGPRLGGGCYGRQHRAGGEVGGSEHGVSFDDWPDDDEAEVVPRRQPASGRGAGSSDAPPARGGGQKRRAAQGLFVSRTQKPRGGAAATRREEAAAKAARFRKAVKQPQTVSA